MGTFLRKLLAPDSPVLSELTMLEENCVGLHPSGICVEHYGIEPAAGKVSSMDQIIQDLHKAETVVTI